MENIVAALKLATRSSLKYDRIVMSWLCHSADVARRVLCRHHVMVTEC